jgi:leader peptidase (prepilin peptidase) / N-methyltransferase
MIVEIVLAALAGLLIGSFLNVCIFRLPRDLSPVQPRSFCPECAIAAEDSGVEFEAAVAGAMIPWYDNIPVVSYVLLGAKCRRCKKAIPARYPLVELATAIAFGLCVAVFGLSLAALKYVIFSAIMITLIATDLEERILPDEFTKGGIVIGLVLAWFVPMPIELGHFIFPQAWGPKGLSVGESVLGGVFASSMIWATGWLYEKIRHREGLGLGDVKMIGTIGAFLGLSSTMVTLVLASLIGSIIGGGYILFSKKQASTYELPFGSFLGVAALGLAAYGEWMFRWYSQ